MSMVETPQRALFVAVACLGYVGTAASVIFWEISTPTYPGGGTIVLGMPAQSFWTIVGYSAATVALVATVAALIAKPPTEEPPAS